jgi:hypothetical protein
VKAIIMKIDLKLLRNSLAIIRILVVIQKTPLRRARGLTKISNLEKVVSTKLLTCFLTRGMTSWRRRILPLGFQMFSG